MLATVDTNKGSLLSQNNGTHTVASVQEQLHLFVDMSRPYFAEEPQARLLLGAVVALTLLNSGVSVAFSYLSRDFWSALNAKDAEQFQEVLLKFLGALAAGVPVVVLSSYQREVSNKNSRLPLLCHRFSRPGPTRACFLFLTPSHSLFVLYSNLSMTPSLSLFHQQPTSRCWLCGGESG